MTQVRILPNRYAPDFDNSLVDELKYDAPSDLRRAIDGVLEDRGSLDRSEKALLHILDLGCGTGLAGLMFRPLAETLVGVDLSSRMAERAEERGVYDKVLVGDFEMVVPELLLEYRFDLVVFADVLIYIGDLTNAINLAASALSTEGGLVAFTLELPNDVDLRVLEQEMGSKWRWKLEESGRYSHNPTWVESVAAAAGLSVLRRETMPRLRNEKGRAIKGTLFVFEYVS
mmetsp:Transcript_57534/g.130366  ORF Transcript_57534/g.130366 Transcript_57534/m.130366 type:complete len:229 (-) Transcript_57534:35-721(-)